MAAVRRAGDGSDGGPGCRAVAGKDEGDPDEDDGTDAEWPEKVPAARAASVTEHGRMYSIPEGGPQGAQAPTRVDPRGSGTDTRPT